MSFDMCLVPVFNNRFNVVTMNQSILKNKCGI